VCRKEHTQGKASHRLGIYTLLSDMVTEALVRR
jgi:hypothetical protein